jgi:hypothetical protein
MQKRKAQEKPHLTNKEFEAVLDKYDAVSLVGILNSFEDSEAWNLVKAFIYYQAAVHGTMSNVLIQESGKTMEACAAGAKAEVLRELIDNFMDQLRSKIAKKDGVVQEETVTY